MNYLVWDTERIKGSQIYAIKAGCRVGYEIVREIYNLFGSAILLEIVDMEEETVSGLESKFIKIGNKLY